MTHSSSSVSSTSSATTSTPTSSSHVSTSSSHLLLLFSNNLINPHSCKFNFIRWSCNLQQFLCCKFFAILDYDYFSSSLLLQRLDNFPTLANDPGHQVSRNHHLKVATSSSSSSLHPHISSHSPRSSVALVGYNLINHAASHPNGLGRPCQGAQSVRQTLAVLGHLDLASALRLQLGDLLPPTPDDQPHHVVGDHHLLAGHTRASREIHF